MRMFAQTFLVCISPMFLRIDALIVPKVNWPQISYQHTRVLQHSRGQISRVPLRKRLTYFSVNEEPNISDDHESSEFHEELKKKTQTENPQKTKQKAMFRFVFIAMN